MAGMGFSDTKLDRLRFFKEAKTQGLFPQYTQNQVNGINFLLDGWEISGLKDLRWLAYMLATVHRETAQTYQPIKEYGGLTYLRSKKYWPFYGRGYVQLTWKENYEKMGKLWNLVHNDNLDFISNPDLAQRPDIALFVMIEGMTRGLTNRGDFTKYSLEDFFNDKITDWNNARRIINGLDKAREIGDNGKKFYEVLKWAAHWR